jgi:hypothetical protein
VSIVSWSFEYSWCGFLVLDVGYWLRIETVGENL